MKHLNTIKQGNFILVTTKVMNKDRKDESHKVYTGMVNYVTDSAIGFEKASALHIYKNGSTYGGEVIKTNFSISTDSIDTITI